MAFATTLSRTSPGRGGATLMRVTLTSSTANATAASHSMVSPAVVSPEKVIGRGREVGTERGAAQARAPEGGAQHGQPEPWKDLLVSVVIVRC